MMELDCGLCVVRPWQASDLEWLVKHANNRNVSIWLRDVFPYPYTRDDGRAWLAASAPPASTTDFAIEVEGDAVGGIGYRPGADIDRVSAEVGYWLGEPLWGQGIATAAVRRFSEQLFAAEELTRLFATPFADHLASRRVLEKAGYALEGILRRAAIKEGRTRDLALYGLVKSP